MCTDWRDTDYFEIASASKLVELFDTQKTFSKLYRKLEALWKVEQTTNQTDENLLGRLKAKMLEV